MARNITREPEAGKEIMKAIPVFNTYNIYGLNSVSQMELASRRRICQIFVYKLSPDGKGSTGGIRLRRDSATSLCWDRLEELEHDLVELLRVFFKWKMPETGQGYMLAAPEMAAQNQQGSGIDGQVFRSVNQQNGDADFTDTSAKHFHITVPVLQGAEGIVGPAWANDLAGVALAGCQGYELRVSVHSAQSQGMHRRGDGKESAQQPAAECSVEKGDSAASKAGPRIGRRSQHQGANLGRCVG